MSTTGYICKQCHQPSPTGVGYTAPGPESAQASAGITHCPCGYSQKPMPDLMSIYRLTGVQAGQADVYDGAFNAHRGHVYRITSQPIDLENIGGMWGVIYPDGTRAGQQHMDTAPLQARDLVAHVGTNTVGATTLAFRTRHNAARFCLLTY